MSKAKEQIQAWPEKLIEIRPMRAGDVLSHPLNPKTHGKQQKEHLNGLLSEVGKVDILKAYRSERLDGKLTYFDGHCREEMKPDEIWNVGIYDIGDREADKLVALFDYSAREAEYEKQVLDSLLHEVSSDNAIVNQMLSQLAEENDLYFGEAKSPKQEAEGTAEALVDRAAQLQKKWATALGQVWSLGEHRLLIGDSTKAEDVALLMGGKKATVLITDPPYGIGWDTDYTRFTTAYGTKRVNHAPIVNDDKEFDPTALLAFDKVILWGANWYCKHIPLGSWLIWDKRHPNGTAWLSDAEIAWMKGGKGVYIYAETVQGAHRKERSNHPTQKPVGLMVWCMEKCNAEELVYDPYSGSGTTLIAAHQTGRIAYCCEIEPKYAAVTLQRWSDLTGKDPCLLAS